MMETRRIFRSLAVLLTMGLMLSSTSWATVFEVGGKPLTLMGFVSQTAQFGIDGDSYDTKEGFNTALTNLFIEGDISPSDDLTFYAAGMLSVDWAHEILNDDDDWNDRRFDKSRDELFVDDEWWQLLKEAHVTWKPGNFMLRVGKQRVSWGEMEVFAANDVINPVDLTRGFADIELDTLFIPIPLVRAQYDFDAYTESFSNMGVQFVFNPNVDHIPNAGSPYGNDTAGIWSADLIDFDSGLRLQNYTVDADEPSSFDDDFFEYGLKAYATINDNTLLSVMGFYGRQNAPIGAFNFTNLDFPGVDDKGRFLVDTLEDGYYGRQKFVGFSLATEVPASIDALGGFRPIFRFETRYEFDKQYWDGGTTFDFFESDTIVVGMNSEYKIRLPWQRGFLTLFGEAQFNKLTDGLSDDTSMDDMQLFRPDEGWWNFYAAAWTTYIRGKLTPMIEWYAINDAGAYITSPSLAYSVNERLSMKVKGNFFGGDDIHNNFPAGGLGMENFDNVVFKVSYSF